MKMTKVRGISFILAVIIALLPFAGINSIYASSTSGENHYLAFASDLHDTDGTLEGALGNFPNNPEYISLIGDMVGAHGGDAPAFNSSDILSRIRAIESCKDIAANGSNASIIWADHDAGVNDDAGIVKGMGNPPGYTSGQIYEGINKDGSTAYYIYAVGFYHMLKGGDISSEAAEAFKKWVANKDETAPIIVLCHAPLVAKRGDNYGATYWSEALNYAATGVEGITTEDARDVQVIRNVIFLSGHNHTVDPAEYVYEVGSVISLQEDNGGKASGTNSKVFYNAITPGYLKTSGSATLITINNNSISFVKYNADGKTNLGVTASGDAVPSPLVLNGLDHNWGKITYTWSKDNSKVTARRICKICGEVETETVSVTKSVTKKATCTAKGKTTYKAEFENPAFKTQTKTLTNIDALGHDWGEPVYKWSEEKKAWMAIWTCSRCGEEKSELVKTSTKKAKREASPDTGNITGMYYLAFIMMISALVIIYIKNKEK